jgi:histidyl-tRNA synthetase
MRTTFEITSGALGAQNSLLGGGRYDGLSELLGGPPAPGFGFAIGEDRLVEVVDHAAKSISSQPEWEDYGLHAYVAWLGANSRTAAMELVSELRLLGLRVAIGFEPAKLKKSIGTASRLQAAFAIIIGEDELPTGNYVVKDLRSGVQQLVKRWDIAGHIKERLQIT